jgi:serine/threonine protein kinase
MILEKCPTIDELRALSLGKLSEEQSDEILGHIPDCEACQAELATASSVEDTLAGHLRSAEPVENYRNEAECQHALAKALGALAGPQSFDDSDVPQQLSKVLSEYEMVRPIGRGGMGTVFLARHTKLGRQVALKVLSSDRLIQPRMRKRFETEMRAIGQLSHPNIVTAYDAREIEELAVLITEFIDGLDVGQILRRTGRLSISNASEIAKQIAVALQYIAEQGLVHRDIKPSNVMIGKTGNVKLLDLGLARLQVGDGERVEMTATGQALGTADYIAPEQVNNSRRVDIRADIYALGCTLFKMLSGQPPFEDERYPTAFSKMTAHVSAGPTSIDQLVPDVPSELAQLVQRMIAKNPNDRPQQPSEVVVLLTQFSKGSDLKLVVEQAIDAGEVTSPLQTKPSSSLRVQNPETKSFLQRRVPISMAIAAGLFGTLIGFALGIIITIKHPDGTISQLEAPNGAKTTVHSDGNVAIEVPRNEQNSKAQSNAAPKLNIHTDKDRLQGVWRVNAPPGIDRGMMPGNSIIAFSGYNYFIIINGKIVSHLTFGITSTPQFSTLAFNGFESARTQTVIQFDGDDKLSMQTEAGKLELERIARLPLTADELKRIDKDPNTVLHLDIVKMIAEFEKTGPIPMVPGVTAMKSAAMQSESRKKLRDIGLALHDYENAHKQFPAAHSDRRVINGSPQTVARSWRVAILPFINQTKLYEQFHLDEDWDSEHNLKLLDHMPEVFRAPGASKESIETPFLAIVGVQTVISKYGAKMRDIQDGTANTIMLIETKKMVQWTKPEDIDFEPEGEMPKLEPLYDGGLDVGFGFHVAFADNSIKFIKSDTSQKDLRALFTRGGDERTVLPQ